MADVVIDTDVVIDHLRGAHRLQPRRDRFAYSVVTRAELFAGRSGDENGVRALLAPFRELGIDRRIAERAGRIRREVRIALPDALIAATALVHGMPLMTRNRRDFEPVAQLQVLTPAG